jgi:toxin HigB-1
MIKSFAHVGLKRFFETGSKAGIQVVHAKRLRAMLTVLSVARGPQDMDINGWRLHKLVGDMKGHWSVAVSGNWRMTFRFTGEDAEVVDYLDYH